MENRPAILREMRICRFCLTQEEPLSSIYVKEKNNITPLSLQIMSCVALEVFANDGMPQLICDDCRTQTKQSYNFKTICKRSDDALKLYLATGTLKRGDEEVQMSKTVKRSATNEGTAVREKRRRTTSTDETKKAHSIEIKTENQDNTVSGEIECPKNNVSEKISDEQPQEVSEIESDKNIQETIENVSEELSEITETEIIHNQEEVQSNKDQRESINIVVHAQITEDGEIIQQPEITEESVSEYIEQRDNLYPNVQIITDPTLESDVVYEEITEEIVPKVPHVTTQCYPCTNCERSFPLQQLLDIHMRQHTRERKFNCNECGKKFFSKHDLSKHAQTHSGTKPFTCIICEKSFSRATLLHRHEKIHNTVPRYLCTYCDKTYLASEDLDAHMRTHKKNRPFQCTRCDKRFAFKQGLERHEIVHNTENPHKCNYCEEAFSTPSKLQRHIQCHAGARPYPCKLCPRTFLLSHHLTRHLKNHYNQKSKESEIGEYKCDVCSMSFERKFSLLSHSAIHSMVNLKCVICNKEFENAQTVKEHITTHLSGLPFLCYKCEYSFENEVDLIEHEQEKHFGDNDSESDNLEDAAQIKQEIIEEETPRRRSQREKKAKKYADFLKDEDFSELDLEGSDEEYVVTPQKNTTIQPVIRSETMKVYKGVKDKTPVAKPLQTSTPKVEPPKVTEPKTLTKITTLEHLGLSKSTLDAMTDKSGYVEMKIGQKVIRVQKLMMTKADVQAMAEQGKIEMKGSKVVVKNTASGILDLNKLTNLGKSSPLTISEDLSKDSPIQKGVRTYVKKQMKKDENSENAEQQSENLENTTEINKPVESINIDLTENNDLETSIEETTILGFE